MADTDRDQRFARPQYQRVILYIIATVIASLVTVNGLFSLQGELTVGYLIGAGGVLLLVYLLAYIIIKSARKPPDDSNTTE